MDLEISTQLQAKIGELEELQKRVLGLAVRMLKAYGGAHYPLDEFALGAVKRSLSQLSAFRTLIESGNLMCGRAILRMQLDTAMRFAAANLAHDPHEFATQVMRGKGINQIKSASGHKMTDGYLVRELTKGHPWFKRVYKTTSGYVHLSEMHILGAVAKIEEQPKGVEWALTASDWHLPEESFVEAVDCFSAATDIFLEYLEGWVFTKSNPELVKKLRQSVECKEEDQKTDKSPTSG